MLPMSYALLNCCEGESLRFTTREKPFSCFRQAVVKRQNYTRKRIATEKKRVSFSKACGAQILPARRGPLNGPLYRASLSGHICYPFVCTSLKKILDIFLIHSRIVLTRAYLFRELLYAIEPSPLCVSLGDGSNVLHLGRKVQCLSSTIGETDTIKPKGDKSGIGVVGDDAAATMSHIHNRRTKSTKKRQETANRVLLAMLREGKRLQ